MSPAFSSPDYFTMMQQCTNDEHMPNGLSIGQMNNFHEQRQFPGMPVVHNLPGPAQYSSFGAQHQPQPEFFDSPQELNRRTMTQEQFDAMGNDMVPDVGSYDILQSGFLAGSHNLLYGGQPYQDHEGKQQDAFMFPQNIAAPLSSYDSTIPSSVSEQSTCAFPSSTSVQEHGSTSANSSEWADSRSSSVSASQMEDSAMHMSAAQQHSAVTTSQWQPGQSVPVDFNARMQEFRQVAQARHPPQLHHTLEHPLAFPSDEAFVRRDSSTSLLAQSMSNIGLQTPQQQQTANFKTPAPPSSIATRRQRPRPAALGLASLRSQSYSGASQPGSPGQAQQLALTPGSQPLRRIRSSNVVNGVAQGRISKPVPGPAQRSPLAWSFAEAANSPKVNRHASQSTTNLAPPTPMSPFEFPRHEQPRQQLAQWHSASGHAIRQPSITEGEEQMLAFVPSGTMRTDDFSSPPQTPMYYQQNFAQHRVGNQVITENTPPQSAPASQSCFPTSNVAMCQPSMHMPSHSQPQVQAQQHMQAITPAQRQQYMNVMVPEPRIQVPSASFAQGQDFAVPTSNMSSDIPMHFIHGAPIVNEQGELVMAFPQQSHVHHQAHQQHQQHQEPIVAQLSTQHPTYPPLAGLPTMQVSAQPTKQQGPPAQAAEFFVHEYSPPQEMKRAATPRKAVDAGPRNYTFANQGPEHFERGKKGGEAKFSTNASSSPASSSTS